MFLHKNIWITTHHRLKYKIVRRTEENRGEIVWLWVRQRVFKHHTKHRNPKWKKSINLTSVK